MRMDELKRGAPKKDRKRVGRGNASGTGTYAGKGMKGQKARSGGGVQIKFEGGQLPLVKRLPEMRGFTNKWRVEYEIVNVGELNDLDDGTEITPELLQEGGALKASKPVKILGTGELTAKLTVRAHAFSASAREKIEAAGGTVEQLEWEVVRQSRSRGANPRPKGRRKGDAVWGTESAE